MGFRINRGIFQFKDGEEFVNKFKIAEDGNMVEVDREGEPIAAYMRIGDKATDSDKLDGYHATNAGGGIPVLSSNGYWYAPSWINVGGAGIYSGTNNAHFLPNNTSPHGSWEIIGTKGNWAGIYFRDSGNTLMANANDSGFYNKNAGWQMEWFNGSIYLSKQANGGGTLATVIDSTTIGSQSVDNADKLDGSHRHEVGNRDYTKTAFSVGGDENTYYPVLITPRGGYAFNRWSISRWYGHTAPWNPIGTGSHKGGLTFDFYWAGDTAWGGNDKAIRIHQFSEQYTTMVGGIKLARTGGMIVWLRGGGAYYELQVDTAQATIDVKLDGWEDGAGTRFDPTGDVNEHRDTIWNNYPVRNGDELFIDNHKVATEAYVTSRGYLTTSGKAADSNLLDGINSTSFLRSDQADTMSGTLTITGSNGVSRLRIEGTTPTIDLDDADGDSFYIHVNSNNFYVLADRDNGGNYGEWEGNHPMQLEADTSGVYFFGNKINSAAYQASSAFESAGAANTVETTLNARIDEELRPAIETAQSTADSAVTAAAAAQATANTAETRANGAREDAAAASELAVAAQTAADSKLGATAKAADSDLLDGISSGSFLRSDADDNVSGNTEWQDNKQIRLGNSADLRIWHDGSHNYFRNYNHGNGNIYFQGEDTAGANHALLYMFTANTRPYVSLYEDGGERFKTTSTGVEVFGEVKVSEGIRSMNSGGYGIIRGYNNDNHFIVIRGSVATGVSDLSITGGHRTTFVEHADDSNEGWYFVSKASGNYTEKARIDGLGNIYSSNIITNQANIQSITSDGTIANDKGSYLHLGGWAVGRTHASAVLVNTAYRADYAESLFDMNISRFTNNSGYITQGSVDALAEELRPQIEEAQSTADGKLGATAKAADSNLLDGIDSGSFLRSDANDTFTGTITMGKQHALVANNYGRGVYGVYSSTRYQHVWSMGTAYNLADNGTGTGNLYGISWTHSNVGGESISGLGHQMLIMSNGDTRSAIGDGIWTKYNIYASGGNSTQWNTAYGWGNHAGLYDSAGSAAGVDARINEEVLPQVTTNATNIERNATELASKLGTTGKAADADKLDGYDWGQSGKNVRATEFYADNWFRNYNSNEGLYNQATGQHWYSDDDDYWNIAGGSAANGIRFRDEHAGTIRGYVYANNSNQIGFLDAGGSWAIKHTNDSRTEFYDADERVFSIGQGGHGSNYGTVCTHGGGRGGYEGYSINERFVWMSADNNLCGMYNDMDNEWMTIWRRNGSTELMHNGSKKLETTSGGVTVTGTVSATAFSGNGSGLTNLTIPDQRVPVTINGEENTKLASINMNLDRGLVEFTMDNGQTFTAQMGR